MLLPAGTHGGEGAAQIDRQHEVEKRVVEGAQIGMRDHSGAAGIVDQDVEAALDRADRVGESFDCARVLRWRAAGAVAGAGQAGDQPVGRLGVIAESDDDTRPGLRE